MGGDRGRVTVAAEAAEDLPRVGKGLVFKELHALLVQGLLGLLGTVLKAPELLVGLVGIVPALVLKKPRRPVVGGDLGVGLFGLRAHGVCILVVAHLVEEHRRHGVVALVIQAVCLEVDFAAPLHDLMYPEDDARNEHQRDDHHGRAAQELSAGLALRLVQGRLHGLAVEAQVLVLAQQVHVQVLGAVLEAVVAAVAALAPVIDLPAGAQPQVLGLQRDEAAHIAGLEPVLPYQLRVEQALVQIRLVRQGLPGLGLADIAAAVMEGDRKKLHREDAHVRVRQRHGLPGAEEAVARGVYALVHMLFFAQHIARAVRADDEQLYTADDLVRDAAQLELCQHLAGLVVHEQRARRDHQRRACGIEILRQGKEPGISFRHRL